MIPRLALDCGEPGNLFVALWGRAHQYELSLLGDDDQVTACQEDLAIAVPAALPFQLPARRVDAREDRFVHPVDEPVEQDRAGELVFHPDVPPDLANAELAALGRQLDHRSAASISGREKHPVLTDHQWL